MIAFVIYRYVYIQDIAVDKRSLIRNAVAYNLIDRCATRLWEMIVVQGRRV